MVIGMISDQVSELIWD